MIDQHRVSSFHVQSIGKFAHGLLRIQRQGKVLAVVSGATYCSTFQEEVFWLTAQDSPMHRRTLQIQGPLPRTVVGSRFSVNDQCLVIGSAVVLDFNQASIWDSPRIVSGDAKAVTDIPEHLNTLISFMQDNLPAPKGFGSLIPDVMHVAAGLQASNPARGKAFVAARAWPAGEEIARACLALDVPRLLRNATELIGLGEGLTPSGDDFVGGLLFCAVILQGLYPGVINLDFPDLAEFIENIKPRTHLISHTLLRDHARGQAMDVLHNFIHAFLTGQSSTDVRLHAERLIQVGHSSGWDLLAGVLTGMLLTFHINNAARS